MSQVEKQTSDKQTKATTHSKGTIWKSRHVFLCHSRYRLGGKYEVLFPPVKLATYLNLLSDIMDQYWETH